MFNSKNYSTIFFLENSIQKLIQKFKFGLIQFNKIFIQLENQGIGHHYGNLKSPTVSKQNTLDTNTI